jgi:hypothetical protein
MAQTETKIQERITAIENVYLPGIREAIQGLVSGEHSEYWLDSGQSSQRVKRLSLTEMREYEKSLQTELNTLYNSLGSSGRIGVPSF